MPTSSETTIVRVSSRSPWFGSVKPTASKSLKRPFASARPETRPTIDASVPTTSASITIERSTCRREAPSVRIVANSRVRCAIVIESEFAITKLPTKSAMPAKASRKPRRKVMNWFVSDASSFACSDASLTSRGRRQDLLDVLDELRLRDTRLRRPRRSRRACLPCRRSAVPSAGRSRQAWRRRSSRPSRT